MQNISHYFVYGTMRNMISGAGLSYAIEKEKYMEVPLTIFFPSMYREVPKLSTPLEGG